ncbi:hypothetical protein AB0L97_34565 [Nocardia sp. NPDC051911]|uniref:hypothetical protein n=1 Tax=Nocardia sp. NPDC051911 TaxID=3154648 RepID=UPI00342B2E55
MDNDVPEQDPIRPARRWETIKAKTLAAIVAPVVAQLTANGIWELGTWLIELCQR